MPPAHTPDVRGPDDALLDTQFPWESDTSASSPSDADTDGDLASSTGEAQLRRATPATIGRFTVLGRLGEGGMGVVYAAYDERLDRKVAVKLLRSGAGDLAHGPGRLLREAQAMARLSHFNIVGVHEVGLLGEEIYVAMEFVRGVSLDAWLKGQPRPWREVLRVLIQAGRGLEAAHRADIVHRDFKPHNVMVTDEGVAKVLDFGLACSAGEAEHDRPRSAAPDNGLGMLDQRLTRTGAVLGTPAYMAPEQHEGRPVTAASDQFAFCLTLYEALYGRPPFSRTSIAALYGEIVEGRIAAPPRTAAPARLFRIVARGLQYAPERRYPSMTALLAELARDPAATRRRALAVGALAGLVGVGGFTLAELRRPAAAPVCEDAPAELAGAWDPTRAAAVRATILATGLPYAADTWAIIGPQLDAYADAWVRQRGEACRAHATGHQSAQLFDLRTACLDQRRAGLDALAGALGSADAELLPRAVEAVADLPPLERCADAQALVADVPPPEQPQARVRVQALREQLARAHAQEDAGRHLAGLALVDAVTPEADAIGYAPLVAEAHLQRGSLQLEAGEHVAADVSFDQALRTGLAADHDVVAAQAISKRLFVRAARLGRVDEAVHEVPLAEAIAAAAARDLEVSAEFLNNVGVVFAVTGEPGRAREKMLASLALRASHGRSETPAAVVTHTNLGALARSLGRDVEAAEHLRIADEMAARLLGERHPTALSVTLSLAQTDLGLGRHARARARFQRLLELHAQGVQHGTARAAALFGLGELALADRDVAAARDHYTAAIAAGDPATTRAAGLGLAEAAALAGDEPAAREALRVALGDDPLQAAADVDAIGGSGRLAAVLLRLGHVDEALARLQAAGARCAAADEALAISCADLHLVQARAWRARGDLEAAATTARQALAAYEQHRDTAAKTVADAAAVLAEVELARGRHVEASALLERTVATYTSATDPDYINLAEARFALARAQAGAGGPAPPEALGLARQAGAVLRAKGPAFAEEADAVDRWLLARGPGE